MIYITNFRSDDMKTTENYYEDDMNFTQNEMEKDTVLLPDDPNEPNPLANGVSESQDISMILEKSTNLARNSPIKPGQ